MGENEQTINLVIEKTDSGNLKKVKTEINELLDANENNDELNLNGMLTTALFDELKSKPEVVNAIKVVLNELDKNSVELGLNLLDGWEDLKTFFGPLYKTVNGNIDISSLDKKEGAFYEDLDINGIKIDVNNVLNELSGLDGSLKTVNDIKEGLKSIQEILEHPTENNTKKLQKFIYDNLDSDEDKRNFLESNFRKGSNGKGDINQPDGLFGQSTFDGLKNILVKTGSYIEQFKKSEDIQKKNDNESDTKIPSSAS